MKLLLQAAAVAALAWLIGCAAEERRDPPLDAHAPLTPAEEFAYGRSIAARLSIGRELAGDPRARAYLAMVGGCVAAASGRPDPFDGWRFYIVKDAKVATWSAPGGFVFISTGALKASKNEDALAGLLAQEMAHSALRHAIEEGSWLDARPTRDSWPNTPGWGREAFGKACDRAAERSTAGWSEAQEQEASAWAAAAIKASGYATEESAVPEARVKRFTEELAAVR